MLEQYLSINGLMQLAVVAFAISQVVMAFWPDVRGWAETITTRSAALDSPVVPSGPTFAIWGVIFAWCLAFAVWQVLPEQQNNDLLRAVAPFAAMLFFFNTLWEAWVPRRGLDWTSFAIIIVETAVAFWIVALITMHPRVLTTSEIWLVKGPLFVFAGWASAATFVNLSSTMIWAKSSADPRSNTVALFILATAVVLGCTVGFASASIFYTAPVAWALAGIIMASRGKLDRANVRRLAMMSIPLVLLVPIFAG